jgi:putative ABC transport system permease protein
MKPEPPKGADGLIRMAAKGGDRDAVSQDLREEFDKMLEEGVPTDEARRWYMRQVLGSIVPLVRSRWGPLAFLRELFGTEGLMSDARVGARMLVKRPGFTALAVLTLALGIGATSAVFTLIHGVLLTPPPYRSPERLVLVSPVYIDGREGVAPAWTPEQWLTWQQDATQVDGLSAFAWTFSFLLSEDGSEPVQGMRVSSDYFATLGVEPILGRAFDEAETLGDADPIILGYDVWMERFGGDPNILGTAVPMSREDPAPVVVGVMPPGVRFLPAPRSAREPNYDENAEVDYWMPGNVTWASDQRYLLQPAWSVVARLADGATPESAASELATVAGRVAESNPEYEGIGVELATVPAVMNAEGERILLPLLVAACLVLLIACGNTAALLLVRGLQRHAEYGIRSAIGAGRVALLRLVTVESLLLALVGGALGVGLAVAIVRGFTLVAAGAVPRLDAVSVGWRVVLFGLGAALISTVAAGAYPAWSASARSRAGSVAEAGTRTTASRRQRRVLAVVATTQAALTLTLLVGAGLLIRTMGNIAAVDSGYETDQVLTMGVTAVEGSWLDFHTRALEAVAEVPGVEGAAFAWGVPLTGNNWPFDYRIEGYTPQDGSNELVRLPARAVTSGYFDILDQRIVEGRDVLPSDGATAPPVAVVNEAFVERYLGGAAPLGRHIWSTRSQVPIQIVGVVADARTNDLTAAAEPEVFQPLWQQGAFSKHLVVRAAGDPDGVAVAVQRALRTVDPTVAIEHVMTLGEIRDDSLASRTFALYLLVAFAAVACILTLAGIYGVLSLSVASRRREIAIRTAIGAARKTVLGLVLREGARVIAVGIAGGLVVAFFLARVLSAFLYGVEPTDPETLAVTAALFAVVGLAACWLPARRAMRVDPVTALRED